VLTTSGTDVIIFFLKGCPGWGANPGPLDFIYFLIFTTLPLSHSGSPRCYDFKNIFGENIFQNFGVFLFKTLQKLDHNS
jgi:hypothetical protein